MENIFHKNTLTWIGEHWLNWTMSLQTAITMCEVICLNQTGLEHLRAAIFSCQNTTAFKFSTA